MIKEWNEEIPAFPSKHNETNQEFYDTQTQQMADIKGSYEKQTQQINNIYRHQPQSTHSANSYSVNTVNTNNTNTSMNNESLNSLSSSEYTECSDIKDSKLLFNEPENDSLLNLQLKDYVFISKDSTFRFSQYIASERWVKIKYDEQTQQMADNKEIQSTEQRNKFKQNNHTKSKYNQQRIK